MANKLPEPGREALYLIDADKFLHLQKTNDGVDYTIHSAMTKVHLSGGHISDETVAKAPYRSYLKSARMEIYRAQGIKPMQVERINPLIASEFYKDQILKPSWELDSRIGTIVQESQSRNDDILPQQEQASNLLSERSKGSSLADANGPLHSAIDILWGNDTTRRDEVPKRESVLNQLKEPVKAPIKVKPHKKTKETPSL
jgi:hypothetical protein